MSVESVNTRREWRGIQLQETISYNVTVIIDDDNKNKRSRTSTPIATEGLRTYNTATQRHARRVVPSVTNDNTIATEGLCTYSKPMDKKGRRVRKPQRRIGDNPLSKEGSM